MSVLILGATSPIAREVATRYAEQGQAIFLAARDLEEAERIASDLHLRHDVETAAGYFDAREYDDHRDLVADAIDAVGPIDVCLIAFGYMGDQQQAQQNGEMARQIMEVNYVGAASIAEAVAEHMTERNTGSIIGISSVAGDRGRQSNYFYGSAKGGFRLYLQGLRNRLHDEGVHVLTVKPGFIDTRMTFGMKTAIPIASPEKLSKAIYKAEQRGTNQMYYPRFWAGIMAIIKAIPEFIFKRLSL